MERQVFSDEEVRPRLTRQVVSAVRQSEGWLRLRTLRIGLGVIAAPYQLILALALCMGTFLRLWDINSLGYNSDEAVYVGQAASIAGDPTLKGFFPIFRAHPLLFQFILALTFRWSGTSDLVGRLAAAAIGIAAIYLVYLTGKLIYGRRAGAIAALIVALMPYHVIVSRQALLDGPMTFFATLTLYLMARFAKSERPAWLYAAGAALGLTFLSKETSIILLGAVYAFLALSPEVRVRIRDLVVSVLCLGVIIAPFPLSLMLAGGGGSHTAHQYLVWQIFRRSNHAWTFYPSTVTLAIGPLVILAAALGLALLWRERTWREKLLVVWIAVPAIFFELWPVKGFQYLLPIAPPIAILAGCMLDRWELPAALRSMRWATGRLVRVLAVVVIVATLLVPSWSQIQTAGAARFIAGSGGVPGGREVGGWIRHNTPRGSQFMTIGPSMANLIEFYGHRHAYGLSVSPNPLRRNPSYLPIYNPDLRLRSGDIQYIVWDSFSAARSSSFSSKLMMYVRRYHGVAVHTQTISVRGPGGPVDKPIIIVYEVHP